MPEPNESPNLGEASSTSDRLVRDPTEKPNVEDRPVLWLRVADRIFLTLLVVALLSLTAIHWLRLSRWGMADVEIVSQQPRETLYSLDINSASWVEWAQLEGVGENLAKRIVSDREERGPFKNATDVRRVTGITPRLLETMKPYLRGGTETDPPAVSEQDIP